METVLWKNYTQTDIRVCICIFSLKPEWMGHITHKEWIKFSPELNLFHYLFPLLCMTLFHWERQRNCKVFSELFFSPCRWCTETAVIRTKAVSLALLRLVQVHNMFASTTLNLKAVHLVLRPDTSAWATRNFLFFPPLKESKSRMTWDVCRYRITLHPCDLSS